MEKIIGPQKVKEESDHVYTVCQSGTTIYTPCRILKLSIQVLRLLH